MRYTYLIIDDNADDVKETLYAMQGFTRFLCVATVTTPEDAVNKILELEPKVVFLALNSKNKKSVITLSIVTELHRYINMVPHFIIVSDTGQFAYDAIKSGVFDYLLKPLDLAELRKSILKVQKTTPEIQIIDNDIVDVPQEVEPFQEFDVKLSKICIKSYGDYQFISLEDIIYLKADNNTTDFYLKSGKQLTAYKTLKHYEINLPSFFYRIHNSYIVNSNYISRINTGKSLCYLDNNKVSVSFSRTYKDNIDRIIEDIAPEYL